MNRKYSAEELNSAIDICFDYLLPKKDKIVPESNNLIDIINDLENADGSEYTHYFPHSLIFKITSGCNLRCKHCFFHDNDNLYVTDNDLSEEELFNYLKFFVEDVNIICCSLTGGEIFTTPYLMRFVEYLKSKNIFVELLSNGTNIKPDDVKRLSEILNPKTDSVQISLEGPEDVNDFIRGKGVFQKAANSIKLLTASNINVYVSMTMNSLNADKIDEMYDICRELKVKQLNIGRMVICNDLQKDLYPNTDDIIMSFARAIKKYRKYKDTVIKIRALKNYDFIMYDYARNYIENILEKEKPKLLETNLHCRPKGGQVALFPNGNISLCYDCDNENMIIGNIKKQSFYEIWNNRNDKVMFKKRTLDTTCKKCKYVPLCKGGCPINAYNRYGTINAPDGECKYAQKMISENIWKLEDTRC